MDGCQDGFNLLDHCGQAAHQGSRPTNRFKPGALNRARPSVRDNPNSRAVDRRSRTKHQLQTHPQAQLTTKAP